jgi:hypothetical protein
MNLKEGTQRVALLLGMVGTLSGGYRSYLKLQPMLPATRNNQWFERAANYEPVQRTIRAAKAHDQPVDWSTAQPIAPPSPQAKAPQIDPQTGERIPQVKAPKLPWTKYEVSPQSGEWGAEITTGLNFFTPGGAKCHPMLMTPAEQARWNDSETTKPPVLVCWDENYTVVSFEEQSAIPDYRERAPSAWEYCWCASLPILGFFIPWAAVRLIAWALAGFAASPAA